MFMKMSTLGVSITFLSDVYNGPLTKKYGLEQFHFHWGAEDDRGSEHLVSGHAYAAEVKPTIMPVFHTKLFQYWYLRIVGTFCLLEL